VNNYQHETGKPTIGCDIKKKFPAFYENLMFVTVFTKAHYWSLAWAT